MFSYKILSKQKGSRARVGEFETPHGKLVTPELAFVATEGEIKAVPKDVLKDLPVNLIITNTFHLSFPNHPNPPNLPNIHAFSKFPRVIMTDSGGFQVFSLGFGLAHGVGKVANIFPGENISPNLPNDYDDNNPLTITDEGVQFRYNDQDLVLTPEKSMDLQHQIGADIMFAFDECTSPLNTKKYTSLALERTHEWLKRCIKIHNQLNKSVGVGFSDPKKGGKTPPLQKQCALFGIVQGGEYQDLRIKSARFVGKQDVPGFGIGGSLGKTKEDVFKVVNWVIPHLPEEKPRHLLGIGQVSDIFEAIERGVDLFDCVIPTREARHKVLYTNRGKINLRKFKNIDETIDPDCQCPACKEKVTFKKLYEMFGQKNYYYATVHNIYFYANLMQEIRDAISLGKFMKLKEEILKYYP